MQRRQGVFARIDTTAGKLHLLGVLTTLVDT
jgi:hypothetical protein